MAVKQPCQRTKIAIYLHEGLSALRLHIINYKSYDALRRKETFVHVYVHSYANIAVSWLEQINEYAAVCFLSDRFPRFT